MFNLVKIENIDFSNRPQVDHLIKGSCLGASYTKSAPCVVWCLYTFCRLRIYFICHVTPQSHSVEMSCIFTGESTSQHVTTLKSLMTIDILIVRGKMLHQKRESHKHVLPLKNWADWTTTRQEKNVTTSKIYVLGRSTQKLKNTFFPLWLPSMTLLLKMETSSAKKDVKPSLETWDVNDVIVYIWYIYSQIKKLKVWNVKRNNFKYSKFIIRN